MNKQNSSDTKHNEDKQLIALLKKHQYLRELDTPNQLLLLQGIDLINSGLEMIEWVDGVLTPNTYDSLTILRDRFRYFKECVFDDTNSSSFMVNRASEQLEHIAFGYRERETIQKLLEELRALNVKGFKEAHDNLIQELIQKAKQELSK